MSAATLMLLWQYSKPSWTPQDAANNFVRDCFPNDDEDRTVIDLDGSWDRRTFRGTFRLTCGSRTYHLGCGPDGRWTVHV